jgi:UDP-N-acetylmuramoylalanine--D-glutamate ligase
VIDEIEFTYQRLDNPRIIAVTGTNGKSTTASLISNILKHADMKAFLGGNISPGQPFSTALFNEPFDYYVLEISSFQLMRVDKFHPYIAVLTNISRDHLNWHRDFEEYRQAKMRIFLNQKSSDYAVVNGDDPVLSNG